MTAAELARSAADQLVRGGELSPCPLPPELAAVDGVWRGDPVRLVARAWRSEQIEWARLVCIERTSPAGEEERPLSIGNLLAMGRPSLGLPVLGLDLVHARPAEVVVATDLVPTRVPREEMDREGLSSQAPHWARSFFSPEARVVRVPPERLQEERPQLEQQVGRFVELLWAALLQQDGAHSASGVRERQAEYMRLHRTDDPGMRLLGTLFGADWASRFLREVMFPEPGSC